MGGSCCACGRRRHCHSFPFIDVSLTPYVTIAKRESDGDWQRQSVRSSFFSSFWKKRGKQKFGPLLYIELRWNRICFSGFRWPPETSFLSLFLLLNRSDFPLDSFCTRSPTTTYLEDWPEAFSHGLWHSCLLLPIVQTIWYPLRKTVLGQGQWTNIVLQLLYKALSATGSVWGC